MVTHPIYLVVAVDQNFGIGKDGKLPWHFKKELQYFKDLTTSTEDPSNINVVIMGRRTWESLPSAFRPLPGRKNLVLTKQHHYEVAGGAEICDSLEEALSTIDENTETVFIIGGANLFEQILHHPDLAGIYLTLINHKYDCDTYLPSIPERFSEKQLLHEENDSGTQLQYFLYRSQI